MPENIGGYEYSANEGASQGKEVFEQAALFLSVDLIKRRSTGSN